MEISWTVDSSYVNIAHKSDGLPLGRGSAGRVINSQPASSMSSISKQSAVSTRALASDSLGDSEAGTGTRMSGSPPNDG